MTATLRRRDALAGALSTLLLPATAASPASARALDDEPQPRAGGARIVTRGAGAWLFAHRASADRIADLSRPTYVGWISGFARWENICPDRRGRYDWSAFDAVQEAAHRVGKPWKDMTILGTLEVGRPHWQLREIPAADWVSPPSRGTFPVPWSARARALRVEYETALAERYGDDPLHAQHRVTLDWPLAEPWFGGSNPQTWMPKWHQHAGPSATWRELQLAYQDIELDAIDTSARLWPDHTVISMATGFAFHDYTTTKPDKWDQPDAHPDRYRTWSIARDRHGDRFQARQNGAGDPNRTGNYAGAQGYGDWIEECFGPNGHIPGPIGCQMVKDIGADHRMDLARFQRTIAVESARCRDAEIYENDLAQANAARTQTGITVRETLARHRDTWQH